MLYIPKDIGYYLSDASKMLIKVRYSKINSFSDNNSIMSTDIISVMCDFIIKKHLSLFSVYNLCFKKNRFLIRVGTYLHFTFFF